MSALLKKEFRLLLPAWIAAMLLAIAPILLGEIFRYDSETMGGLMFFTAALGCLILGTVGFGREFESRTFALLLAQPWQRRELWSAKINALMVSLLPLGLWLLLFDALCVPAHQRWSVAFLWLAVAGAVTTGGLWTTLLLRQFFSAFWISVLLPFGIVVSVIGPLSERISEALGIAITCALAIAYSVAGYFLARWLFRTAQDTQWTGGDLTLSSLAKLLRWTPAVARPARTHPLLALLRKEFHLHESSLLAAGLLLIAQLAALLLARLPENPQASLLGVLPMVMWLLWLLMPALVGCAAVAEERKLGTLEPQLCLPVSRARQFLVKVSVTLALGAALGAVVPMITAPLNPVERLQGPDLLEFAWGWTLVCLGITIICFYASSLTRYTLHAFAMAIAFVLVWFFLLNWLNGEFVRRGGYFMLFGHELWRGPLAFIIAPLVMLLFAMGHTWRRLGWIWLGFIALVSLALYRGTIQSFLHQVFNESVPSHWGKTTYMTVVIVSFAIGPALLMFALAGKNFKHTQSVKSLWLRNVATWAGCLPLIIVITALVYNRAWDFGKQFEPPAGAARLSGLVPPVITNPFGDGPTFVLLPDGRLCSYTGLERIPLTVAQTDSTQPNRYEPNLRATTNSRGQFIGGSNWVAIATTHSELIGIKSDGSLWSVRWSEWAGPAGDPFPNLTGAPRPKGATLRQTGPKIERIGNESDWKAVAGGSLHFITLKRDGTIWGWGNNTHQQLGEGPKTFTNGPVRIGNESDWTNVFAGRDCSFGVKRDGSIWKWGARAQQSRENTVGSNPVKLDIEVKGARAITSETGYQNYDLILDERGTLWGIGNIFPWHLVGRNAYVAGTFKPGTPGRLPAPSSSAIAAAYQRGIAGIKPDGTLWDQDATDDRNAPIPLYREFGKRTDWIAVAIEWDSVLALAKDGTICRFGEPFKPRPWSELLAPIRRVTWSINLLDAAK